MADFESCREVVRRGRFTDLVLLVFWSVTALLHFLSTELFRVFDELLVSRRCSGPVQADLSVGVERQQIDSDLDEVSVSELGEDIRSRGFRSDKAETSAIRNCSVKKMDRRSKAVGDNSRFIGYSKFYVVKKGRVAGIYPNWEECNSQVYGFKGAQYKSFRSLKDALNYQSG
ncbi:hypothetical protein M758_12G176600 [Ceratodon purpureus]|nr:hypothetical protein M758_12G176600 [Ceratodon purpureus]